MKKQLMAGLTGLGVAAALVAVPAASAEAATSGSASCPSGRVVAIDAAGQGTIKVYVNGSLVDSESSSSSVVWGYRYTSHLSSLTYKVTASARAAASWTCVL